MRLILVRHGECERLLEGIYNGWDDYKLTENGVIQAHNAGKILVEHEVNNIDKVYTSVLVRTKDTAKYILNEVDSDYLKNREIESTYFLNERHYGTFQGKDKKVLKKDAEYTKLYSNWSHEHTKTPEISDGEYAELLEKYSNILNINDTNELKRLIPRSESLVDVENRVNQFFNELLKPYVKDNMNANKTILLVSHSNTLKLIVKKIEGIKEYKVALNNLFATCGMYIYELDDESFVNDVYDIKSKIVLNNKWYA